MNDTILQILIKAQDQASAVLGKINNVAQDLAQKGMGSLTNAFEKAGEYTRTALVSGMLAGSVAMGGLITQAVKGAGEFEQYRATLTVMLGSQEEANKRLKEYADIGAKTPFELPQVVALGNQLQAIGKYSKDNVMMLGDLASAAGKPIEQVSSAFSKLATGQKGVAVDMFRDLLISTEDWSKATGKGISKSGELMATTEEMLAALPKIMKDKKFVGMMEEQSKTFIGKMSNLVDAFNSKLRDVGDKLLPYIKPALDSLISFVSSVDLDTVIESFKHLGYIFKYVFGADSRGIFEDTVGVVQDLLSNIGISESFEGVQNGIESIKNNIDNLRSAVQPTIDKFNELNQNGELTKAILEGVAVVVGGVLLVALWGLVAPILAIMLPLTLLAGAIAFLFYAWNTNMGGIQQIVGNFMASMQTMWSIVQPILMGLWDLFMNWVWPSIQKMGQAFIELWQIVGPLLMPVLQFLGQVLGVVLVLAIVLLMTALKAFAETITWVLNLFKTKIEEGVKSWQQLSDGAKFAFSIIKEEARFAANFVLDKVRSITNAYNAVARNLNKTGANLPTIDIPRFAKGVTNFGGGMALVGEQGPELVSLPSGSNVYTNQETQKMMTGQNIVVNISNVGSIDERQATEIVRQIKSALKRELAI